MGITTLATTLARHMIPANSSRIIGFLTALYAFGQMVGPAIAGVLMETTQSFHAALFAAAGSVLLGAFLMTGGMRYEWNRDDKVKGWKIKEGL